MRPDPLIIGISGKAYHGKDTCAGILKKWFDHMGDSCEIVHFADELKRECALALAGSTSISYTDLRAAFDDPQAKRPYRGLLQWWGTDFRRAQDPLYWIKLTHRYIDCACNRGENQGRRMVFIIPDLRATNELEFIRSCGGIVVRVERLGAEVNNSHPIETMLDDVTDWDFVINNDGDLIDLEAALLEPFHQIRLRL